MTKSRSSVYVDVHKYEFGVARSAPYYCKHCGKTVRRASNKEWVKSYCERAGRTVHLTRVATKK